MPHLFKVWDSKRDNRVFVLVKDDVTSLYEQLVLKGTSSFIYSFFFILLWSNISGGASTI